MTAEPRMRRKPDEIVTKLRTIGETEAIGSVPI